MKCGGLGTAKTLAVHTIKVLNVMAKSTPSASTTMIERTHSSTPGVRLPHNRKVAALGIADLRAGPIMLNSSGSSLQQAGSLSRPTGVLHRALAVLSMEPGR